MKVKITGLTTLGSENKIYSIKALRSAANIGLKDAKATVDVLNGDGIGSYNATPQYKVEVDKDHPEFTNFEQYFKFVEITRQLRLWHCSDDGGNGYLVLATTRKIAVEELEKGTTVSVVDIWEIRPKAEEGEILLNYKMV